MKNLILLVAALASASAFASNDIAVTAAKGKSGSVASVDFVSDGNMTMAQFKINVGDVDASQVDLSAATAGLPKSHSGQCGFVKGTVICVITNDDGVALPAGVVNIGKISVRSGAPTFEVTEFLAADRTNAPVHGTVRANNAQR